MLSHFDLSVFNCCCCWCCWRHEHYYFLLLPRLFLADRLLETRGLVLGKGGGARCLWVVGWESGVRVGVSANGPTFNFRRRLFCPRPLCLRPKSCSNIRCKQNWLSFSCKACLYAFHSLLPLTYRLRAKIALPMVVVNAFCSS